VSDLDRDEGGLMAEKHVVRTEGAPAPLQGAPYSQAIRFGDLVFVAGQVAVRPGESEVVGAGIQEQTEQAMRNVGAILEAAGSGSTSWSRRPCSSSTSTTSAP